MYTCGIYVYADGCILNKQIKLQLQVGFFGLGQFTMVLHANFCHCVCLCVCVSHEIWYFNTRWAWHVIHVTALRDDVVPCPCLFSLTFSLFPCSTHLSLFIIRLKYSTWRRLLQQFFGADKNWKEFSACLREYTKYCTSISQFFSLTEWQGRKFYSSKCR